MKIRKLESSDIPIVVELWYETSILAHSFISPDYWKANRDAMATTYLPDSETYVAVKENEILGFVSMVDNYLAAIFVRKKMQGSGVGKKLLDLVKETRSTIELKVYKKNIDSVNFYKKQGFEAVSERLDESTKETEVFMKWNK